MARIRGAGITHTPSRLIHKIIDFLYPTDCPACKNPSFNATFSPFCSGCWSSIKRYSGPACKICFTFLSSDYAELCVVCMKNRPFFTRASSFGCYEGVLAEAINLFKFLGVKRLSNPLGRLLLACDISDIDTIIPVPLSIKSLRKRGFNQSSLLAKVVSDNTGIPLFMNVLTKKRETLPQIGLSAKERISNIKGAFRAERDLHGMKVLLIDDVMTTTATANECSKELLTAGAKDVTVLTLARASDL